MGSTKISPELRFIEPDRTEVGGSRCEGMTVRAAGRALGHLQGFIVDPLSRRLRYLVVRTLGFRRQTTLLPLTAARINIGEHVIDLLDQDALRGGRSFSPALFPRFSDDDLLTAIFGTRSAA